MGALSLAVLSSCVTRVDPDLRKVRYRKEFRRKRRHLNSLFHVFRRWNVKRFCLTREFLRASRCHKGFLEEFSSYIVVVSLSDLSYKVIPCEIDETMLALRFDRSCQTCLIEQSLVKVPNNMKSAIRRRQVRDQRDALIYLSRFISFPFTT